MSAPRARPSAAALQAVLALLERHHGVGARGASPAWLAQRLERALAQLGEAHRLGPERLAGWLAAEPTELARLAELLRVGETRFYRDAEQWSAIAALARARPLSACASVGCSTGEEAWTLACVLAEQREDQRWRVVGMDRSAHALAIARRAHYSSEALEALPSALKQRSFHRTADGAWTPSAALRARVDFVERDLTQGPPARRWDLLLCKNVLIYFGAQAQARAIQRLLGALGPEGLLLVARSEVPLLRAHAGRAVELAGGVVGFHGRAEARSGSE